MFLKALLWKSLCPTACEPSQSRDIECAGEDSVLQYPATLRQFEFADYSDPIFTSLSESFQKAYDSNFTSLSERFPKNFQIIPDSNLFQKVYTKS
jgi:hypothetical protein